jgi:hypothetical protein
MMPKDITISLQAYVLYVVKFVVLSEGRVLDSLVRRANTCSTGV